MDKYTVKKTENDEIFLVDESGKQHSVVKLLEDCGTSRVVALDAPMGTGKTTLIKQLCEEMGTEDVVNSPTFAIVNVYDIKDGNEIYHFDCYRLKEIREAIDFGAEEYLYSGNWCFVEWPEIISPILPEDTITWKIRVKEDGDRELWVEKDVFR